MLRKHSVQDVLHPPSVRAAPIDPAAGGTLAEGSGHLAREGRDAVGHVARRHLVQRCVVHHAPREERRGLRDAERRDDGSELLDRLVARDLERTRGTQLAQQVTVAGEQDTILASRALDDLGVRRMQRELRAISAEGAQPPGVAAEHRVGEKAVHMPKRTRRVSISCPVGSVRMP